MNANELRIGSLISLYRNPQDKEVCIGKIKSIYYSPTVYECYVAELDDGFVVNIEKGIKRITLTEEWLLKFGFFIIEINGKFEATLPNFRYNIYWNKYTDGFLFCDGETVLINFNYVHELQNLVFVLGQRELTVA